MLMFFLGLAIFTLIAIQIEPHVIKDNNDGNYIFKNEDNN